jgi:hypothetical protein
MAAGVATIRTMPIILNEKPANRLATCQFVHQPGKDAPLRNESAAAHRQGENKEMVGEDRNQHHRD